MYACTQPKTHRRVARRVARRVRHTRVILATPHACTPHTLCGDASRCRPPHPNSHTVLARSAILRCCEHPFFRQAIRQDILPSAGVAGCGRCRHPMLACRRSTRERPPNRAAVERIPSDLSRLNPYSSSCGSVAAAAAAAVPKLPPSKPAVQTRLPCSLPNS